MRPRAWSESVTDSSLRGVTESLGTRVPSALTHAPARTKQHRPSPASARHADCDTCARPCRLQLHLASRFCVSTVGLASSRRDLFPALRCHGARCYRCGEITSLPFHARAMQYLPQALTPVYARTLDGTLSSSLGSPFEQAGTPRANPSKPDGSNAAHAAFDPLHPSAPRAPTHISNTRGPASALR